MDSNTVTDVTLQADPTSPPDLTSTLQGSRKRIAGHGSFGTVYHCPGGTLRAEVAVKAITFPHDFPTAEKDMFMRKLRREFGIWKRLDHPNIVPFLGTADGDDFGSDHACMVSMWMPHGTLINYVKPQRATTDSLSQATRIQLIKGTVAGLEYLHSKEIVHGDFHPGNILIDSEHNVRLVDFGFSRTLSPVHELSYLWTRSILAGAVLWAAPELLYPDLYQDLQNETTLHGDIYSLGSIILFILSGEYPWPDRTEAENKLKKFQSPSRPKGPANIPDGVWKFIERCWSPRRPRDRPSAHEALSFSRDRLEQLLQPRNTPPLESRFSFIRVRFPWKPSPTAAD